ncbi:MAG: methyltransferase domain-containing protein [Thermomicrobiales bacterium]|nr:methyltransferase domain-containing protein [Thermomicrobiales bacterium]
MCSIAPPPPTGAERADALLERIFSSVLATFDIYAISLGDRLGYYRALQQHGPQNAAGLAVLTGTNQRYTREWLEQQATTGILDVAASAESDDERVYALSPEFWPVLTEAGNPSYGVPMARLATGAAAPFDLLVEAFRSGAGVPYEDYGIDLLEGQGEMNRPQFQHFLGSWVTAMPDVERVLNDASRPARIADIGMGTGWSSIALAKAFPHAIVDGYDLDEASVVAANRNAAAEGVADRVTFHHRDAGDSDLAGKYDLATAFECIHDMWDPVSVLGSMRRLVGPRGTVLVMDERVADQFGAIGDDVERFMYGFSFLHCLPVGMVKRPSAGTGTVMRSSTFKRYATEAGFANVDILPIENDFFNFYRLTP